MMVAALASALLGTFGAVLPGVTFHVPEAHVSTSFAARHAVSRVTTQLIGSTPVNSDERLVVGRGRAPLHASAPIPAGSTYLGELVPPESGGFRFLVDRRGSLIRIAELASVGAPLCFRGALLSAPESRLEGWAVILRDDGLEWDHWTSSVRIAGSDWQVGALRMRELQDSQPYARADRRALDSVMRLCDKQNWLRPLPFPLFDD